MICWQSRQKRNLAKAVSLCKDYGLMALAKQIYIGNIRKRELEAFQENLRCLFSTKSDKLLVLMVCKSCLEISTVPETIQSKIVEPPKYELVG